METDDAGSTQVVYNYEPAGYGKLISQRRGAVSGLYLFDALGSTQGNRINLHMMGKAGSTGRLPRLA